MHLLPLLLLLVFVMAEATRGPFLSDAVVRFQKAVSRTRRGGDEKWRQCGPELLYKAAAICAKSPCFQNLKRSFVRRKKAVDLVGQCCRRMCSEQELQETCCST